MSSRKLESPSFQARVARNVHIYNHKGQVLGGLYQNGSITKLNFYEICRAFLAVTPDSVSWEIFFLNADGSTGRKLNRAGSRLSSGQYIVLSTTGSPIDVTTNGTPYPRRVTTHARSSRLTPKRRSFRDRVRARDGYCMISGIPNALAALDNFTGFQAAHIYPHAREAEWITRNYQSWITDTAPASQIGSSGIHSCQNGILLNASLHTLFDTYAVAVNPDGGYKVISFVPDSFAVDGRILEPRCRDLDDPNRISDDALRWHFQQAILAHVRGTGQRYWETDFPDGDMIGEIIGGPDAAERMEVELFTRLGCGDDAYG